MNDNNVVIEIDTALEYRDGKVFIKKMNTNEMPANLVWNLIETLNKTIIEYYREDKKMKWTHDPGEPFPVLALNQNEAKLLTEILVQHARGSVRRKAEKYKDIHESGEATEKQQDLMFKYENQLNLIDNIILYNQR